MTTSGVIYQRSAQPPVADLNTVSVNDAAPEDQEILQEVSQHAPALRSTYETDLAHINSYIHTAEATVKADPTDEQAQRALMNAYEQRSMVYQMAFERPLQ